MKDGVEEYIPDVCLMSNTKVGIPQCLSLATKFLNDMSYGANLIGVLSHILTT